MTKLNLIAFISFILTHIGVILFFIFEPSDVKFQYLMWILGAITAITNILLADKLVIKKWVMVLFTISGIMWILPILLITYFGIPCLLIFFIIGVYVHKESFANFKSKKTA